MVGRYSVRDPLDRLPRRARRGVRSLHPVGPPASGERRAGGTTGRSGRSEPTTAVLYRGKQFTAPVAETTDDILRRAPGPRAPVSGGRARLRLGSPCRPRVVGVPRAEQTHPTVRGHRADGRVGVSDRPTGSLGVSGDRKSPRRRDAFDELRRTAVSATTATRIVSASTGAVLGTTHCTRPEENHQTGTARWLDDPPRRTRV